ncbi:hypothetical protein [Alloactinosynnema sp. L-07]|nr:hypothetical protein [Alloactinosynnema sp. L-07]
MMGGGGCRRGSDARRFMSVTDSIRTDPRVVTRRYPQVA